MIGTPHVWQKYLMMLEVSISTGALKSPWAKRTLTQESRLAFLDPVRNEHLASGLEQKNVCPKRGSHHIS